MSESPQQPAAQAATDKKTKDRSPNYPAIGLRKALEFAQKFFESDKRQFVLVPRAAVNFGFTAKGSGGMLAISAMKKYGLLNEEGSGETRKVQLTDKAIALLNPSDPNRSTLLKEAALRPNIHKELWGKSSDGASNGTLHDFLVFDKKFIAQAADTLIEQFNDTIQFANLRKSDKADTTGDDDESNRIGDVPPKLDGGNPISQQQSLKPPVDVPPASDFIQKQNVLAAYKIPLGRNEAQLTFTGERLEPDDFDALADYVAIFKKQFERKEKARNHSPQISNAVGSLSKKATKLRESLISHRPARFTPKEAEDHSVLEMSHLDFVDAWKELNQAGEIVVVSLGNPNIYALKENA